MATVIVLVAGLLAVNGTITGADALAVMGTAAGFSLGASSGSGSGSVALAISPPVSTSSGTLATVTPLPSATQPPPTSPQA